MPHHSTVDRAHRLAMRAGRAYTTLLGALATGLAILSAASCTIKEDRSRCACTLELDASFFSASEVAVTMFTEDCILSDTILRDPSVPGGYASTAHPSHAASSIASASPASVPAGGVPAAQGTLEYLVPRRGLTLSIVETDHLSNIQPAVTNTAGTPSTLSLLIPAGKQMDSLFACVHSVDARAERAYARPVPRKQFATVSLEFKGEPDGRAEAYGLLARSGTSGVDLRTLLPLEGGFQCEPLPRPDGGYAFRVPRQRDPSTLVISILRDGLPAGEVPVGELARIGGFDWEAPDLGDIHITADIPEQTFELSIQQWKGPVRMTVQL